MDPATQQLNATEGARRLWNNAEDELLVKAVEKHGPKEWDKIAAEVGSRKDWQCRERWHNHLKPGVCKKPWEAWEDELLEAQVHELGTAWATIVQSFPGRPTTSVKNRWHQLQRQHRRRSSSAGSTSPSTTPTASPFTSPLTARATYDSPAPGPAALPATNPAMLWPNLNLALHALQLAAAQPPLPGLEQAATAMQQQMPPLVPDAGTLFANYSALLASTLPSLPGATAPMSGFLLHADPTDHATAPSAALETPPTEAIADSGSASAADAADGLTLDSELLELIDTAYLAELGIVDGEVVA